MANVLTLPVLGVALLVAAGAGVYLGESSIGMIKPVYFQGPALHPRDRGAAVDPNQIRPRAPAYADHYGWVEGRTALAQDCGDCDALAARDAHAYSAVVPYFGSREDARPGPEVDNKEVETVYREPPRSRASEAAIRIERYAHYPVSEVELPANADYKSRDVYFGGGDEQELASRRQE